MTRRSTIRSDAVVLGLGLALALGLAACKKHGNDGGGPGDGGGGTDAGGPCIPRVVTWSAPEDVDLAGAGFENVLRFNAAGVPWIATMRSAPCLMTPDCTGTSVCIDPITMMMTTMPDTCEPEAQVCQGCCMFGGNVTRYDNLLYEPNPAGGWMSSMISSEVYVRLTGVGFAINPAGDPCVAYTGAVGGIPPMLACGAHDLLYTCRTGGAWTPPTTVITLSATPDTCNDGQDACNVGDVTGLWPSLAFSSTGEAGIAYRDQHNGWNMIDQTDADLEVALDGGSGAWASRAPYNAYGGGLYGTIAFDAAGNPAVAHDDFGGGVVVTKRDAAGMWTSATVSAIEGDEHIQLAIDGANWYVLYYTGVAGQGRLTAVTSEDDGVTWTTATIDTDGITGRNPSLRIMANGKPAVSYYRCSDASSSCVDSEDSLKFAYYECGTWLTTSVEIADDPSTKVAFPALDFDPDGNPGIAYQENWSDPGSGTVYRVLRLVRGTWGS